MTDIATKLERAILLYRKRESFYWADGGLDDVQKKFARILIEGDQAKLLFPVVRRDELEEEESPPFPVALLEWPEEEIIAWEEKERLEKEEAQRARESQLQKQRQINIERLEREELAQLKAKYEK